MTDLKPCPFCGGAAHFFKITDLDDKNFGGEGICCGSCPITTDLMYSLMDDCKPLLAEKWNRRAPRLEAAAAEYERGRQDGMKQEHALWKLAQAGQEIEAAAVPELSREDVVRLAREAADYANAEYPRRRFARDTATWWQLRDERFASLVRSNCPEFPDSSPAAPQPGDKL